MPRPSRLPLLVLILALALPLAACGGGDGSSDEKSASAPKAEATPDSATAVADLADSISKDTTKKPQIAIEDADPPAKLTIKDIVVGKGKKVKTGDKVSMQYVGSAWSTGQEFDASWDRGQPFDFTLGGGQVIKGWDQGIAGMRPGGRRLLVIPPELGYGEQGSPPAIGPNETLAFVVDLVK
jgi:peptidylprolyl isomerase